METVEQLEPKIVAKGKDFFASISNETPSLFNKAHWTGKVMDWCMKNENFKVQLFRFVDVLPCLTTGQMLTSHIEEYFGAEERDIPAILKWGGKRRKIRRSDWRQDSKYHYSLQHSRYGHAVHRGRKYKDRR